MTATRELASLIASRRDGWSLPGEFYRRPDVYDAEMESIWRSQWVFAGHSCQLTSPGDFLVVPIHRDSVLVIRGEDGSLRAMHNVCRHRGTLLCSEEQGNVSRLVCPYHQWVYGTDGSLISCRGMQEDLEKADLGLKRVRMRTLQGMIFLCLSDRPPDFDRAGEAMAPLMEAQGLPSAKVAKIVDYEVEANWKLV